MKLVKAILLFCLFASLQAQKTSSEPLWAQNCNGDVKKRIEDIKHFQMVARMTQELAKQVQEGLQWIQANCLKTLQSNPNLNCLGNVMERIKILENTLMTSRFVESVRKPLEEELVYLREVCQGKCPQNPAKAISELEAQMIVSMYTAEKSAELQNRLQFWKVVCLKQACPQSREELITKIQTLEFTVKNSKANETVLKEMREELARLKTCLKIAESVEETKTTTRQALSMAQEKLEAKLQG